MSTSSQKELKKKLKGKEIEGLMGDLFEWLTDEGYNKVSQTGNNEIYCNDKFVAMVSPERLETLTAVEDLSTEDKKKLNLK